MLNNARKLRKYFKIYKIFVDKIYKIFVEDNKQSLGYLGNFLWLVIVLTMIYVQGDPQNMTVGK